MAAVDQSAGKDQLREMLTAKIKKSRGNGRALYRYLFDASREMVAQWFSRSKLVGTPAPGLGRQERGRGALRRRSPA
jgi:hypothetical protein